MFRNKKTNIVLFIILVLFVNACKKEHKIQPRHFFEAVRATLVGKWRVKNMYSYGDNKSVMEKYMYLNIPSSFIGSFCTPYTIPHLVHIKNGEISIEFRDDYTLTYNDATTFEVLDSNYSAKHCYPGYHVMPLVHSQVSTYTLEGGRYYASTFLPMPVRLKDEYTKQLYSKNITIEFDIYPVSDNIIYLYFYQGFFRSTAEQDLFTYNYTSDLVIALEKVP
jgi:hypothetical protein